MCSVLYSASSKKPASAQTIHVRVLLARIPDGNLATYVIRGDAGFTCIDKSNKKTVSNTSTLEIKNRNHHLYINGKRCPYHSLTVIPCSGNFTFNGKQYQGACHFVRHERQLLIVNIIDLERYVSSVVRSESWPGWPIEINKVFAIASRSYALAMRQRSRKLKKPFDVESTNKHQTYAGTHTNKDIESAVRQTRGIFLCYEGNPIVAMFDCCCGGIIPAHIEDFDFSSAPYLAREYVCHHCKQCKIYRWCARYTMQELRSLLARHMISVRKIKDVEISHHDKAGLARSVVIKTGNTPIDIPASRLCSIIKEAKSCCFTIKKQRGDVIQFEGRGYGHQMGICQWGAREMVRDGWDYKTILRFYYPQTSFAKVA